MILKNLVVKTGSYENKAGETVGRYKTIGHVHSGQHGEYITLNADVNLAAFPRKEGDDRVMVSMYDPKGKDGKEQKAPPKNKDGSEGFDDDIQFTWAFALPIGSLMAALSQFSAGLPGA